MTAENRIGVTPTLVERSATVVDLAVARTGRMLRTGVDLQNPSLDCVQRDGVE